MIACSIVVQFSWGSIWWILYHASSKYNTLWSTTNIDYYFWQVCKAEYSCSLSSSGTSVSALGSFTMEFFTSGSDMDLSLSLGHTGDAFPRKKKIQVLKKLIKALYGLQVGGKICVVEPVPRAIVPVLKYVYWRSGIECDISIENKDGIWKSELIHIWWVDACIYQASGSSIQPGDACTCFLRTCPPKSPFNICLKQFISCKHTVICRS